MRRTRWEPNPTVWADDVAYWQLDLRQRMSYLARVWRLHSQHAARQADAAHMRSLRAYRRSRWTGWVGVTVGMLAAVYPPLRFDGYAVAGLLAALLNALTLWGARRMHRTSIREWEKHLRWRAAHS